MAAEAALIHAELQRSDTLFVERIVHEPNSVLRVPVVEYRLSIEPMSPLLAARLRPSELARYLEFRVLSDDAPPLFTLGSKSARDLVRERIPVAAGGEMIGQLYETMLSLIRGDWRAFDASGVEVFVAREARLAGALARRLVGSPHANDFSLRRGGRHVGQYTSVRGAPLHVLELGSDLHDIDRRLALAWAVAVDVF
jgi:hypothetical protein